MKHAFNNNDATKRDKGSDWQTKEHYTCQYGLPIHILYLLISTLNGKII